MTTTDPADVTALRDALLTKYACHGSEHCRPDEHDGACQSWMDECRTDADALIAAVRADATRAAEVEVAYVNTGSAHDRAMAWSEGHTAGYEEALVPQREQMVAVPVDMGRYTASRYDTDTLHRLHIWNGERSWDIDVPRAALAAQPAAPVTCGDAPIRCTLPAGHDGGHHDNEGGWAALAAQPAAPEPHSTTCLSRSDDVCTCKPRPAQPAAPEKPSTAPDGFYGASKDFWDALNPPAPEAEPRLTHGRHCRCTPCAREDWTRPDLAHCGMHGPSCPAVYAPFAAPCEHDWHYYDGNETEGTESICSKCRTVRDDAQPIAPDAEPERCAFRGCGMPMIDVRHDFATPDDDRLTRHTFASAAPDGRTHHVGDECPGGHR
ncbi:MAG: hypothetical protein ACH36H_13245 [Candidatus Nanopelagicales bacterium]